MPLFTHENAAILGKKGNLARWAKPPLPPPAETIAEMTSDFAQRRLMRVRDQLERLDALASGVRDTKRLKELADATTRLSEQERILAGRPLPGSRRPREDRTRVSAGWIELQPALPSAPTSGQPTPVITIPAKPLGWEYDTPTAEPSAPTEPEKIPGDVTP